MERICDLNHISLQVRALWSAQRGYVGGRLGAFSKPSVMLYFATHYPRTRPRRDAPGMADNRTSLRVVIQPLGLYPVPSYRVIVYGDELKPMHADFESAAVLLEALQTAVPGFDVAQLLLNPLQERQSSIGSIVFDGEMPLSGDQRSALGAQMTW